MDLKHKGEYRVGNFLVSKINVWTYFSLEYVKIVFKNGVYGPRFKSTTELTVGCSHEISLCTVLQAILLLFGKLSFFWEELDYNMNYIANTNQFHTC